MARRPKEEKKKTPKKKFAFFKTIGTWLVHFWHIWTISLLVILIGLGIYSYLNNSPQFNIKKVEIKDGGQGFNKLQTEVEKLIIGTNIFQLNLEFVSQKLQNDH